MTQHFLLSLTWIPALLLLQTTRLAGTQLSAGRSSCSHMRNICFPLYSPVCSTLHSEGKNSVSGVQLNAAQGRDLKMSYGSYSKPLFSPCLQEKRAQHNEVLTHKSKRNARECCRMPEIFFLWNLLKNKLRQGCYSLPHPHLTVRWLQGTNVLSSINYPFSTLGHN